MKFPVSNGPSHGFITYLISINKSHLVHLNATTSRFLQKPLTYYYPEYAIDRNNGTRYGSIANANYNQFFQIQLNASFFIQGYSLQYINTVDPDTAKCYVSNWEFSAGNSLNDVFDVLHNEDGNHLLKDGKPHIFDIPLNKQKSYHYFQVTNKGPSGCSHTELYISEIDIFGIYYEHHSLRVSIISHYFLIPFFHFILSQSI